MKISGKEVKQKYFLFDGCHKFYLINERKITKDMQEKNWSKADVFPINDLPSEFYNSCSLRFIQDWESFKNIVPQCRKRVTFSGYGDKGYTTTIDFEKDVIYTNDTNMSVSCGTKLVFRGGEK